MDPATSHCPTPRLAALRALIPNVLIGHEPVTALEKLADSWLLSCPSSSSFGEECELVISILYIKIVIPDAFTHLLPEDLMCTFMKRWVEEDGSKMEIDDLLDNHLKKWKCGAAQVVYLLFANVEPEVGIIFVGEDDVSWPHADVSGWPCTSEWLPNMDPPAWLLDAVGSSGDLTHFISLLSVSASVLQDMPIPQVVEPEDSYLGTLTRFLCGVRQYQEGKYSSSLDTLHKVNYMACEGKIQAWVSHIKGLGLAKIGKSHTALFKLQDAVNRSPASIPALYNIAQVFHSLGQERAELEVLDLLVKSGGGQEMEGNASVSLHSSLLARHHTVPEDLTSRAQFYLACRYLQAKRFVEAAEKLETLLDRETPSGSGYDDYSISLLRREDRLPALPSHRILLVLAAVAHAFTASHKETLRVFDGKLKEQGGVGGITCYKPGDNRMRVTVSATGRVLRAEALKGMGRDTEALQECIRLEQAMWTVCGVNDAAAADDDDVFAGIDIDDDGGGSSARKWDPIILQIKTFLYKMMSELHKSKSNLKNYHHYSRLTQQCHYVLQQLQPYVTGQNLSSSNYMAMDGIYQYFKQQLNDDHC